jgi:hypothetical protein
MTSETLPATMQSTPEKRELALLRAVGLDRAAPEQRELALAIADRYGLDLMLKHLVLIEGRPYLTRDALLHIAHRSGQLDGMDTSEPTLADGYWRATCSVYRKDMSRPFTYSGRYPEKGGNAKFAPEMALKVAESMALRRAFDIAAPSADERWDAIEPSAPAAPAPTLAEVARQKAAVVVEPVQDAPGPAEAVAVAPDANPETDCGDVAADGLMTGAVCVLEAGHAGAHKSHDGSWPR